MKRLFVAIKVELSDEFRQSARALQANLSYEKIVWEKDDLRHLTLRFLGATPDSQIEPLKAALADVARESESFTMQLDKMGLFGSRYAPDVIWFGFEDFTPFRQLFDKLESRLQQVGFGPAYGNFVPHVTVARIKHLQDKQRFRRVLEQCRPKGAQTINVSEIILYQSFLHSDGPVYKPLATYSLK